jgi:hypothetical protein
VAFWEDPCPSRSCGALVTWWWKFLAQTTPSAHDATPIVRATSPSTPLGLRSPGNMCCDWEAGVNLGRNRSEISVNSGGWSEGASGGTALGQFALHDERVRRDPNNRPAPHQARAPPKNASTEPILRVACWFESLVLPHRDRMWVLEGENALLAVRLREVIEPMQPALRPPLAVRARASGTAYASGRPTDGVLRGGAGPCGSR